MQLATDWLMVAATNQQCNVQGDVDIAAAVCVINYSGVEMIHHLSICAKS